MAFTLPELGYADDALEPHIDERTMSIHRTKHHQAYVTNLNNAVTGTEWEAMSIEEICRNITAVPENIRTVVRNNGGGHANHSLFWKIMGPNAGGAPTGALADAIAAQWVSDALAAAGPGWWSRQMADWMPTACPIRTAPICRETPRFWASTSGNMPTT